MPDLSTIQGASLQPRGGRAFELLQEGIKTFRTRGLAETLAGTPSPEQEKEALVQLSQVDPLVAQTVQGVLQRNDLLEQQALAREIRQGVELSAQLKGMDFNKQTRILRERAAETIAKGGDPSRLMDLIAKDVDERRTEFTRMQVAGTASETLLERPKKLAALKVQQDASLASFLKNIPPEQRATAFPELMFRSQQEGDTETANLIEQLGPLSAQQQDIILDDITRRVPPGKLTTISPGQIVIGPTGVPVFEAPPTVKPQQPLSPVGKARADLRAGRITQDDFDALAKVKDGGSVKLGGDVITKQGGKFFFAQQVTNPDGTASTVLSEIPGSPVNPKTGLSLAQEETIKAKGAGEKRQAVLDVDLKMVPRVEGAKISVKQRLQASNEAFGKLPALNEKIGLYDQAIDAVKRGAGTGPIEKMMPTFRAATFELQNIQQQLGLNILSGVTMGSLSENEMSILLSTAIPTGLDGPELLEWLETRKTATIKLRDFTEDAVTFLRNPNNTIEGFIANQRVARAKKKAQPRAPQPGQARRFGESELTAEQKSRLEQLRKKQR